MLGLAAHSDHPHLPPSDLPAALYEFFAEELYRTGDTALPEPVHEVSQDLEGIGPVRTYFVDVEDLAGPLPPPPDPSVLGRVGDTVGLVGRGLPYMLRLRRRPPTASAAVV